MGKTIAIIVSAAVFSAIGLGMSYVYRDYLTSVANSSGEIKPLVPFLPPVVGGVFGLITGCIAVSFCGAPGRVK